MTLPLTAPYRLVSRDGFPSLRSCDYRVTSSRASSAASTVTSLSSSFSERSQQSDDDRAKDESVKYGEKTKRLRRKKSKRKKMPSGTGLQPIEESLELVGHTFDSFPHAENKYQALPLLPHISNTNVSSSNGAKQQLYPQSQALYKPNSGCDQSVVLQPEDPDTGTGNSPPWMRRSKTELLLHHNPPQRTSIKRYTPGKAEFKLDPIFKSHVLQLKDKDNAEQDCTSNGFPKDSESSEVFDDKYQIVQEKPLKGTPLNGVGSVQNNSSSDVKETNDSKVWQTLPMSSELQSYITRINKKNGRDASFSQSLNISSFKTVAAPNARPHTSKSSLIEKQRSRFGRTTLRQNMQNTVTQSILTQQNRTYELHSRMKTMLKDGILRRT